LGGIVFILLFAISFKHIFKRRMKCSLDLFIKRMLTFFKFLGLSCFLHLGYHKDESVRLNAIKYVLFNKQKKI
jgi:heme/copper-type cytochrome/quinol oxidase subunit 4